jgi:SAM-dependent methyltransferase
MAHSPHHSPALDPSAWIVRFAGTIAEGGSILDLACGRGRHGRLFLANGHPVTFLDKDISAVADLAGTKRGKIIEADLEESFGWPLNGRHFDGVVVTNYLWRPILPAIIAAVAPGGVLLYETFADGNEAFGRPRNPDFLLRNGELIEAVRGNLEIIAYEQCQQEAPRSRIVQHIAARRPR